MRDSDVAWHTKQWSDGFGHVIHNWFAVGRPVFGYAGYYASQLAGPLWVEGVTSFDLEGKSPDDVVRLLAELRQDEERHLRMSEAAAARFREVVNFDDEAEQIRAMFAQVLP
jgi:glycosyltransferase involved in cell wall biosynthesis